MARKIKHTSLGLSRDQKLRSKQNWERGLGARRKGNPRYKLARVWSPAERNYVHRYVLRRR